MLILIFLVCVCGGVLGVYILVSMAVYRYVLVDEHVCRGQKLALDIFPWWLSTFIF